MVTSIFINKIQLKFVFCSSQTNLGQISTNASLNEFGIQNITLPGMQISIGPAHVSSNGFSNCMLNFVIFSRTMIPNI